jgi:transcriptional regulator with XRE-family HTH domain
MTTTTTNLKEAGRNIVRNTTGMKNTGRMSISEMAIFSGISERTLCRIETARKARQSYKPAFSTVAKLATAAGVTIDVFVKNHLTFQ